MKTARNYINHKYLCLSENNEKVKYFWFKEMEEYAKQALELAAERALVTKHHVYTRDSETAESFSDGQIEIRTDKQSILSIIDEIE